jgi:gliding motility-associated-like protein
MFTLTADDGCEEQTFTVTVMTSEDWDRGYFYVPNSFSPNGDGMNDLFMPLVGQDVEVRSFEFKVFDRWGNTMFSATDHTSTGWDGLHRTNEMQNAVFVWYLKAIVGDCMGEDKELFQEGGVTIVR